MELAGDWPRVYHPGRGEIYSVRHDSAAFPVQADKLRWRQLLSAPTIAFILGCAVLAIPTMIGVAQVSWSTEQGGHGPLVMATGAWLLWRELTQSPAVATPGRLMFGLPALAICLTVFILARITGTLEVEAFAMYGSIISGAYLLFGGALLRSIWFPLIYLAFALPPPESVVAAVTQPIKIAISEGAVWLLHAVGYPIASSGVTIQIAQYELLVAAACAGLNSIVTLSALCLLYSYLRHRSDPIPFVVMCIAAIPVAMFANFIRVLVLILLTYHFGEATAQGFLHDAAGLLMFSVALLTVFAIDQSVTPVVRRLVANIRGKQR